MRHQVAQLAAMMRAGARPLAQGDISRLIDFSRITLIVGLVFLHYERYPNATLSPFRGMDPAQAGIATFVNSFVLFFFFSVVPLLSLISGWLFFSFTERPFEALTARVRRRFVSLYLPLICWNAFYLALMLLIVGSDPGHPLAPKLNIDFTTAMPWDYVNAVFGISHHPIGFQFWFVRDLFVTALVSPLLYLSLRYCPVVGALVLGGCWLRGFDLWVFFRSDVVFFFYLGGLVRQRGLALEIAPKVAYGLMGAYLALVALRTLAPYVVDGDPFWLQAATRSMRLVGVLACWGVFQQIAFTELGGRIARFGGLAFFLHAAHFPLLAAVKLLLWDWIPEPSQGWMLAHYAASVALTVLLCIGAAFALARALPQLFAYLNGGRLALR
jgi:hypothetical protein